MTPAPASLTTLGTQFATLSLMAFGGANAVVPEIHRQAVQVNHWMSDRDFAGLFAIAQAAPGPNFLISTLVGWKAAGLAGALVATLAMCAPSCLLTYAASRLWERHRDTPWRVAVGAGLAPVAVGLIASSAYLLVRGADRDWRLATLTCLTAAVAYLTKLNPLWCLGLAAGMGALGFAS